MASTRIAATSLALCVFIAAVTSDQFLDLNFIKNPGNVRIVHSDNFNDRVVWLFPFLPLSLSGTVTGWVFRGEPHSQLSSLTSDNVPYFQLWQEFLLTPNTTDYQCVHCESAAIQSVELYDDGNLYVYKQTLNTPLLVDAAEKYILGIHLPAPSPNNLNLSFQYDEIAVNDRLSFFFSNQATFYTINDFTYRDNLYVPLVNPLYGVTTPEMSPSIHTPSVTTTTGTVLSVTPSLTSGAKDQSLPPPTNMPTPTTPPHDTTAPPPDTTTPDSSNQPPMALIIGAILVGLVLVTLTALVLFLLIKYHQLKFGKRNTHLENPTYQVPENRAQTGKSAASSNGSYQAYATPSPATFLSASLPPLTSHQVAPHIPPPPLVLHHYEVDDDLHLYDQPGRKATTLPPPLPYEIPMAPSRGISRKHHIYSELECGEFPSLRNTSSIQDDKRSVVSSSQSSSIFDNSIYKHPNNFVPRADGALSSNEDLYWKPATSSQLLYDQLSHRKFQEIRRDNIRLTEHLGSGQFGTVNKGAWQSRAGSVEVAVKQLQLGATELDRVKFLQEAVIMGQFYHPNVVKLHGVVTKDDPIMIVLEYMPNGDLRNSLLKIRPLPHDQVPDTLPLLLLRFCQEVATGMAYLSKKAFVHRDLAARNILLDSNSTCKIGDFGMSRDLEDSDYYITHGGIIPVKWTAPEALLYKKYSTASDVWSFGCLMYEIWSLGYKPFEQYGNLECMQLVGRGYRLPPPAGCCRSLYKLMILCWHNVPSQRPVFSEMQHVLTHLNTQLLEKVDPQLGRLGGPLEAGEGVYSDLQDYYIQDQTESSSDSR